MRVLGHEKGAEIGSAVALELGDNIYIPIHDHSGHISVLLDLETQTPVEEYIYNAFGEEKRYGTATTNPWHFSSKRLDPESGWIYFGRRYYDPPTGRWTTPDPIGFTEGPNLYAYAKNSPLTHFDLYGLTALDLGSDQFTAYAYQQAINNLAGTANHWSGNLASSESFGSYLWNRVSSCVSNVTDAAALCGYHFPTMDPVHSLCADYLQSRCTDNPYKYKDRDSCVFTIRGKDHGYTVMAGHGQLTDIQEGCEFGQEISRLCFDSQVTVIPVRMG